MLQVVRIKTWPKTLAKPSRPRIYFWPIGESVAENLFYGRHNRPIRMLKMLLPEVLEKAGYDLATKAKWSQHAGCSCLCSPGFILGCIGSVDVHVEYKEMPVKE